MVDKPNKSYILPRDWWSAKSFLWWLYPLLVVGLYKLFKFIMDDISTGVKYNIQEIWSIIISVVITLGTSLLILWLIYHSLKKTHIEFTKKELIVNSKKTIKWEDLIGYTRTDNSVTLIDYKDIPHRFYTGNLTYYVEEDLKKFTKEIPEKKK